MCLQGLLPSAPSSLQLASFQMFSHVLFLLNIGCSFACLGGGLRGDFDGGQTVQNPTFNIEISPPTSWTYYGPNAIANRAFFIGQPATKPEAEKTLFWTSKAQ
ncbi:hypothetical protein L596_026272 [Steinernema carpocapsae]|uniref:Uncharacterized protein n=1 Tax=Steinernema carpocapsae TaxID=34508 RepID=A0A4U5M0W8_STECR|nr:hypothetical protein L596_026272 [Steinernema carpocapsae]